MPTTRSPESVVLDHASHVMRTDPTATDRSLLIQRGDRLTRLSGEGAVDFVEALLALAEHGELPIGSLDDFDAGQAAAVREMLNHLVDAGLLVGPDDHVAVRAASSTARALWDHCGRSMPVSDIQARLDLALIGVAGESMLASRIASTLCDAGLAAMRPREPGAGSPTAASTSAPDLRIVVGEHEHDPRFDAADAEAADTGVSWWAVIPHDGVRAVVGPFMLPGVSACWTCFRLRRAANFPDRTQVAALATATTIGPTPPPASSPGLESVQSGLLVEQVVERIGLGELAGSAVPGGVTTMWIDGDGMHLERHRVLRVPRCRACSPATNRGLPQVCYHGSVTTEVSS